MKRILAFALCALLLLSACGDVSDSSSPAVESSDSASAPISLESDTVCTKVTEVGPYSLDINAQYVRTDSATDKVEFPSAVVIKSRKQLDDYYLEYKDIFPLERVDKVYSDTTIGFLELSRFRAPARRKRLYKPYRYKAYLWRIQTCRGKRRRRFGEY